MKRFRGGWRINQTRAKQSTIFFWVHEQKGDLKANVPTLGVVYSFDDDEVHIYSILVRLPSL
jgi:hypothetical protein